MGVKSDTSRYYKEIKKHLTCSRTVRDRFLLDAHRLVNDLLENQPNATYEKIVENIGTPEELSEAFLNTLPDETEVKKYRRLRQRKKRLIIALLLLTIMLLLFIIVYTGYIRSTNPITVDTVTIIYPESSVSSSVTKS